MTYADGMSARPPMALGRRLATRSVPGHSAVPLGTADHCWSGAEQQVEDLKRKFGLIAVGSRSTVSLFDYKGRLYQLEAKVLPGASDGPAATVRFEQSLVFTDGGSNRSEATIRAIREGCHSDALNGAGNPINPAGLDDPR